MLIIQNKLVTKEVIQHICFVKISPSFSSVGREEFEEGDINDFRICHQSLDKRFSDFNLSDN